MQYCISNQSYTKVVKVVIVVSDLSMQEISNVFLWTHNQLGLLNIETLLLWTSKNRNIIFAFLHTCLYTKI